MVTSPTALNPDSAHCIYLDRISWSQIHFTGLCLAPALQPLHLGLCVCITCNKVEIHYLACNLSTGILSFDLNRSLKGESEGQQSRIKYIPLLFVFYTHTHVCLIPIDGPGFRFSMQNYDHVCILCYTFSVIINLLQLKSLFRKATETGNCIPGRMVCIDSSFEGQTCLGVQLRI